MTTYFPGDEEGTLSRVKMIMATQRTNDQLSSKISFSVAISMRETC